MLLSLLLQEAFFYIAPRADFPRPTATHSSMPPLTDEQVRTAVRDALDALPSEFAEQLGDVAVVVEDTHPDGLMGIYDPVGGLQRIVIFRDANPNVEEVRRTVWHEVGHVLGMDEERLRDLGYE